LVRGPGSETVRDETTSDLHLTSCGKDKKKTSGSKASTSLPKPPQASTSLHKPPKTSDKTTLTSRTENSRGVEKGTDAPFI
jgi:hypothetical protein